MARTARFSAPLRGVLHAPATSGPVPCVLVAHGFKGFMGWGMFPWLAGQLAAAGFAAVRFDFSHNGADQDGDFKRLDLFRENTLGKEQEDLDALLDAVTSGVPPFGGVCRPERIGLVGHSRGGGGVILCAARRPEVAAVAGLAATARADRFPDEMRRQAEEQGFVEIPNARTGQQMPVGVEFFRDAARRDIPGAAAAMTQPLLLIHGGKDEAVPVEEARTLAAAAGDRAKLVELPDAGHTFGAVHPWQGPTGDLESIAVRLRRFFGATLS